jgi:bifunctional ADP-heptose synthase (sugar kinase/adenylyltransferase)
MITTECLKADDVIIIIGDLLIDRTCNVHTTRISSEAPVLIGNIQSVHNSPGGAGLGVCYALKNNIPNVFLSAISEEARHVLDIYNIEYINICNINNNIEKIRYKDIVSRYQLFRADTDDIVDKPDLISSNLLNSLKFLSEKYTIKAVVILDYIKGLLDKDSRKELINYCSLNSLPTYIDAKKNQIDYTGASILKFNSKELQEFMSLHRLTSKEEICRFLKAIIIIETKGDKGAEIFISNLVQQTYQSSLQLNTIPDVSGCGDVFDISFCNNLYLLGMDPIKSFEKAVDSATLYAYSSIDERLL